MRCQPLCVLLALVIASASSAVAAPVPWSNPNGSAISFDWSNGHSDNGLFGSPTLVGDKFVFFPSTFKAASSNGVGDQLSDRLQFTLLIKPQFILQQIAVNEEGNYSILGNGAVHVSGGLWAKNLNTVGLQNQQVNAPLMPVFTTTAASGEWDATATVLPSGWTQVEVVLNNILQAITTGGSVSNIEKTVIELSVVTTLIPEPGSATLLLAGGAALLLRRRKRSIA